MGRRTYACPGETSPPTCVCACYGCKHHCAAHNPPVPWRWIQSAAADARRRRGPSYRSWPLPRRGDAVDHWLVACRKRYQPGTPEWLALNAASDDYERHADTRTPLHQPVAEGDGQ